MMSVRRRQWCAWMSLLAVAGLGGCMPSQPKTVLSRTQLVDRYNANAAAVPQLWARAKIAIRMTDEQGRRISWGSASSLASPNGLLLVGKGSTPLGPHDFVLIGRAAGATELFRLGNSAREGIYYAWYNFGEHSGARWGRDELAGAPGVDMPIDPMSVLSVLAVTELPDNFANLPTVVMTLHSKPYAYVLTCIDRRPVTNEIVFRREIHFTWSDSKPPLPYLVNVFDSAGKTVMTATLRDYKRIDTPGGDVREAAAMPTDIEISYPQSDSSLHMVLSEMTTENRWDRSQASFAPNMPRGIPLDAAVQVDKGIGGGGAAP